MCFYSFAVLRQENNTTLTDIGSPICNSQSIVDAISPLTTTTDETATESTRDNEDGTPIPTRTPITMTEILRRIDEGDANSILVNKDLHYFFLKNCVVNVITKKKWKENSPRNNYYKFITPSDEGFAFVVLDNNVERYRAMQQNTDPDYKDCTQPRYTNVTTKGSTNNVGKGWNDRGKMEFQRYTEMVMEKRNQNNWLEKRARMIKKMVNRDRNNNKKRSYDTFETNNSEDCMDKEALNRWNQFMMNSINNMSEPINSVAL